MRLLPALITLLTFALTLPSATALHLPFPFRSPHPNNQEADQHDESAKRAPRPPDFSASPPSWDNASLFLLGQRAMLFSGEFHPFRLPVPSLWADVLEKMKALGLSGVSFYVPWALLEGKPGEFRAEGVFDLAPMFEAAGELGLWLVARPGPYISE